MSVSPAYEAARSQGYDLAQKGFELAFAPIARGSRPFLQTQTVFRASGKEQAHDGMLARAP